MNRLLLPGLCVILSLSLTYNCKFWRQAHYYRRELERLRLDPIGLSHHEVPSGDINFPLNSTQLNAKTLVFLGDSRAHSWLTSDHLFSSWVPINLGIDDQTSTQVLNRIQDHVAPLSPSVVVVQVGINDLSTIALFPDQEQQIIHDCKNNILKTVQSIQDIGSRVVITTIFPLGDVPWYRRPLWFERVALSVDQTNDFIRTLKSERVYVLDVDVVLSDSIGGNVYQVKREYTEDLLHINGKGYEAINKQLETVLNTTLDTTLGN